MVPKGWHLLIRDLSEELRVYFCKKGINPYTFHIDQLKEKFGATYFPKTETKIDVPNDRNFNTQNKTTGEIKITRKTSIRDLFKK